MASVYSIFYNTLYFNIFEIILITIFSSLIVVFLKNSILRVKLGYFFVFIIIIAMWGIWASFDVFMMFLLATEFLIVIFFLLMSLLISAKLSSIHSTTFIKVTIFLGGYTVYFFFTSYAYSGFTQAHVSMYILAWEIIRADLFIFFQFFFIDHILLTFYLILLIGLFSIAFIWIYFSLRKLLHKKSEHKSVLNALRHQMMAKQSVWKPKVRFFQK